ncbi:MAG: Mrp/NBP35 family ATP-binding protein [Bdellovibrionales bacterium]|nr:Mrp/NBP35 family ATP-binding protein [Bdellovibrionales bacterium]
MPANSMHEEVLNALRKVEDPDLKRDLVSLNMIQDLEILNGQVKLRVVLTTPACPMKAKIEADVKAAVLSVEGIQNVEVKMDSRPRGSTIQGSNSIPGVSHIIAVSSGKGGVGKSTVAVNLAVSLARAGAKVGILDADVYGPNIPTMMGVTEGPQIENHPTKGELFLPPTSHGVKVMSMGFLIQGDQPLVWRGPMLHNVVSQFCHKVNWGELDYLVVDMPPGTGDVQLSLAQLVPVTGAVLVSTPQEVSMQDVRKAYHMFEKVRVPVMGFVENMSYFQAPGSTEKHYIFGKEGGQILAKKFGVDLLAQIPIEQTVREGGDEGRPISVSQTSSDIATKFADLAGQVVRKVSVLANQAIDPSQIVQIGKF